MRTTTPVSELSASLTAIDRVAWQLASTPHVNAENTSMDVAATLSLMYAAGLGGLILRNGEVDDVSLGVQGYTSPGADGTVAARASRTVGVTRVAKSSLSDPDPGLTPAMRWPIATVTVDYEKLSHQVAKDASRSGHPDARDAAYCYRTDGALRRGIFGAALKNLITHPIKSPRALPAAYAAMLMTGSAFEGEWLFVGSVAGVCQLATLAGAKVVNKVRSRSNLPPQPVRLDLLPAGVQPLHLIGVGVRASSRRLLQPLPSSKS